MTVISMTVPQMRRQECAVDGHPIHLTPTELSFMALLLVTPPGTVVEYEQIIEALWPDPDTQPLTAYKIISVVKYRLLLKGIETDCCWSYGIYSIAADRRTQDQLDYRLAA